VAASQLATFKEQIGARWVRGDEGTTHEKKK
jgi:hypothetical protein